jgi:hypothetical protein
MHPAFNRKKKGQYLLGPPQKETTMGDKRRGPLFAKFIVKQFPKAKFILDIAGGKGQVARSLANKGVRVHVIDAQPRLNGNSHSRISYQSGFFESSHTLRTHVKPDMIVGMHPDEATGEIIEFAVRHELPFAVVPCCRKGRHAKNIANFNAWIKKLKSLAKGYEIKEHMLKMRGKNLVLYGRPK